MPTILLSSDAKRRTLDGPPGLRSRRHAHDLDDEASSSEQEEGPSSENAGGRKKLRGIYAPRHKSGKF
jgi:hypothetical protein